MTHIPKAVMEECFRGKRTMGKPRCRWEDAVWISAMDTELENSNNEERSLEEEDMGRPWPENRLSTIENEE
jgi:hypothetical protein